MSDIKSGRYLLDHLTGKVDKPNMQRDRLNEYFRCHITAKVGKPLGKSRTSVGKPTELTVASDTSFGVVSALGVNIADYHADASNAKLLWDPEGPKGFYVKVAANTTQDK
ncbi:hypothetical protein DYB26_013688 [Aphanomyces astaci]|uniref:Uncharacterized protein n=1 Tax=Aphanomyces astaci TaxID=112090 RepID=A0A397FA76_APHAT|nr:hypothetical protein DYB26_013688 [Aphanomyces astaci]RHZ15011.1 hypothetical protein DYB31_006689 [Aphanomyces astaci]